MTNRVLSTLWLSFWHLLPANPILVRVVYGASRRVRHLYIRAGYLAALLLVVLFSLIASMSGQVGSLAELAKSASQTFKAASMTQLALMCFLAPVFTSAAITQERDAQTFNILLSTPLTNAQIVFGSLISRLYFVVILLLAGLPVFLVTMVYGGVTMPQVLESFSLSGSTAILTGALAIFVAMMRVGTRGTIYSFYLLIGCYLISVYFLGQWDRTWVEASPANIAGTKMSCLTPLHPFLALDVALNRVYPPPYSRLKGYGALLRSALAYPSAAYVTWTTTLAFLLTVASILFVRRGAKTGEATLFGSIADRFRSRPSAERTRPPRNVWSNPVAWREAKTLVGSGALLRWSLIVGGLVGSALLFYYHADGSLAVDDLRRWLAGLITIQFAVALIIATNTAATSMTKEKESQTMDLLLGTPLTSKYILWGKLRGLVSFATPLLLGPVIVLLGFGVYGLLRGGATAAVWIEVAVELGLLMVIFTACACVIGLRISLVSRKNVTAVMWSIGAMVLLCGILTAIGVALVTNAGGALGAFFAPFTPFTSIWYLVDPVELFDSPAEFADSSVIVTTRLAALLGTAFATGVYSLVVWSIYSGLVRNFDMIVRKQSGT